MKHIILSVALTGLVLSAYSNSIYPLSDSSKVKTHETVFHTSQAQNNYAVGISGSSKLPLGYQLLFNLNTIGRAQTNIIFLLSNQFSSHSNYDLCATVTKRELLLRKSSLYDLTSLNIRSRKLHFPDEERTTQSYNFVYSIVIKGKINMGAGIACDRGTDAMNGLILSMGRFFPGMRVNISGNTTILNGETNWKGSISKTFSLNPESSLIYGLEVSYEEYMNYNDVSVGMIFYL